MHIQKHAHMYSAHVQCPCMILIATEILLDNMAHMHDSSSSSHDPGSICLVYLSKDDCKRIVTLLLGLTIGYKVANVFLYSNTTYS